MGRLLLLSLSAAILGCATTSYSSFIEYRMIDQPDEQRLELRYKNDSERAMCLGPEQWPNATGKLNQMGDAVFLVVGNERFPVSDFNTGYCPDDCSQSVAPGEEIVSQISYVDFKLPDRLRFERKTLEFHPQAYPCK